MGNVLTSTLVIKGEDQLSKPLRSTTQALRDAEKRALEMAKAMSNTGATDRFATSLSRLKLSAADVKAVTASWSDYTKAQGLAAKASDWTKAQIAGVRAWERQTISSLREVKREQQQFYRSLGSAPLAVSPMMAAMSQNAMANARLASGMSAAGARGVLTPAGSAAMGALAGRFGSVLPIAGGFIGYEAVRKLAESGSDYQRATVALRNVGLTLKEMGEVKTAAENVSRLARGTSATDALAQIRETIGAFGSLEHAIEHAGTLAQINSVLKAAGRESVTSKENAQNFVRYFEERQIANNAVRFQKEAKEQARAMVFFGEKYNPSEMFNFAQQAKSTLVSYNERFATKIIPSLVTMSGGEKTGTAARMFDSTIMGRVRDQQQAREWMRLGLLDPKQVVMTAGHPISWKPGAVKNSEKAMRDPLAWIEEDMIPALKKGGYDPESIMSMRKALGLLYRNSSANFFASELALPGSRARLHKDEELQNRMGDFDSIYWRNQVEDPAVATENLKAAFTNLGAAVAKAAPIATGINKIAAAINFLADAINFVAHPFGFGKRADEIEAKMVEENARRRAQISQKASEWVDSIWGGKTEGDHHEDPAKVSAKEVKKQKENNSDFWTDFWKKGGKIWREMVGMGEAHAEAYPGSPADLVRNGVSPGYGRRMLFGRSGGGGARFETGASEGAGGGATDAPLPSGPPGTYRPIYKTSDADLSDAVVNTIAGEAHANSQTSVDAVVNNMLNRVGTKTYGPSGNLRQVARAPGQYAGYRSATEKEAAFIRSRIRAIASGEVPDNTHGSNEYRAGWYMGPWGRKHADSPVIGGNRFAYNPKGGRGPYAAFDKPYIHPGGGTKTAGAEVGGVSRPHVDASSLRQYNEELERSIRLQDAFHAGHSRHSRKLDSFGKTMRTQFATGGIKGE